MSALYANTLSVLYNPEADLESTSLQSEATKAKKLALRKKPDSQTGLNKKNVVPAKTIDLVELEKKVTTASPSPAKPKRKQNGQVELLSPSVRPKKLRRRKQID